MDFTIVFFILMTVFVISYILGLFFFKKRVSTLFEVFFLFIYSILILILLFPGILRFIEDILGINSALQFMVYLSIFVAYFLLFILYKRQEEQRAEMTKLIRKLALENKGKK